MKKVFSIFSLALMMASCFCSCHNGENTTWEYKVMRVDAVVDSTYKEEYSNWAKKYVLLDNNELNALGAKGWELVSVQDEIETVFVQTAEKGNGVIGIKPNTRASSFVLLFKRQKKYE